MARFRYQAIRDSGERVTGVIEGADRSLVMSRLSAQGLHPIDVKEQGEEEKQKEIAGLTVNVLADGSIVVNDQTVSLEALDRMIDEAIAVAGGPDKLKPLIRADRKADSTRLNEVFNRLSGRGLSAIRLATERGR